MGNPKIPNQFSPLVRKPKDLLLRSKMGFRSGGRMDDEKWLERRYYGGDLPAEAERALHAAGLVWEDEVACEGHIKQALSVAPNHIATNFGAFRFYYYRHRLKETLPHLEIWLREAIKRNGLPEDWREVSRITRISRISTANRALFYSLCAAMASSLRG